MSDIFVISDTHFFHENILRFDGGRGEACGFSPSFSSVDEMNEYMIDRWNSVVKPGDKVYHLGDVAMGPRYRQELGSLMSRLNGSKRLIVGNHDEIDFLANKGWFKKIMLWRNFKEYNIILTHLPLHEQSMAERWGGKVVNVHGHIHRKPAPSERHICVSVEQINYTPVHIEDLK